MTLRIRIALTLVPLLALLLALGGASVVLLSRLGGRVDEILRENYDSVLYMEHLDDALKQIDSSFQFALNGQDEARQQYEDSWTEYRVWLEKEQGNITLPGEGALVAKLTTATADYRRDGDAFFAHTDPMARSKAYFGQGKESPTNLRASFEEIKSLSKAILRLNQKNMEDAAHDARVTATSSLVGLAVGMTLAVVLGLFWARHTVRTILQPLRAMTESALAIGAGNLDQVVPVTSADELGQLAGAFNRMARQLRDFRKSQQTRLRRLQQTTQAAIDSFPHPVLLIDPDGRIELANPAMNRLLGLVSGSDAAAPPWNPPEALRQPLREALREQRAYLPEGFNHTIAFRSGDVEHFFLPRILPIRASDGMTLGAALLLEDVTRYRLLDEVKSNLVATVSHELKTPLTSLRLVIHLLLEETVGSLNPKQLELLLDARENSERLLAMINNLLDLARLQEGRRHLDLKPESPAELLKSAAETVHARAEDKGVTIAIEADADLPSVNVDVQQMGHALQNLLDNALTYTARGGHVTLSATAEGDTVTLSVADTGSGIPPEFLPHVFERFFRIPGKSSAASTGLGLAIVREIVTAHDGSVTCTSRVGEGTVFRLMLPTSTRK